MLLVGQLFLSNQGPSIVKVNHVSACRGKVFNLTSFEIHGNNLLPSRLFPTPNPILIIENIIPRLAASLQFSSVIVFP